MKSLCSLLMITLCLSTTAIAQKRKKAPARPPARQPARQKASSDASANTPRIVGSQVVLITKNDDRITGTLLDLNAYSARIKADNLESTIALDTLASISFNGSAATISPSQPVSAAMRPEFAREAESVISAFQSLATQLKNGADYSEYGRQLTELRRTGEQFILRNSASENSTEARVVALLAGALTDYTWARTIWTLKFGRSGNGTVSDTESPAVTDTLLLYADLRTSAVAGNRFSVDKLVSGIWGKAAEKTDRARTALNPSR